MLFLYFAITLHNFINVCKKIKNHFCSLLTLASLYFFENAHYFILRNWGNNKNSTRWQKIQKASLLIIKNLLLALLIFSSFYNAQRKFSTD